MTDPSVSPPPGTPAPLAGPPQPGFFTRLEDKILPHAEADVAHIAADVQAALQDHAGTVFDVAAEGLALLKLIDPADTALAAAAGAFLPKLLAMAGSAARVAGAALKAKAAP